MDLSNSQLILALAVVTLVAAAAFAIYQRIRVAQAKRNNEHSALTDDPRPATAKTPQRR